MQVTIHEDRLTLARAAADRIAARAAVGPMNLGLAGGTTPADTYRALADRDLDWSTVDLWLSDERWVPPGDIESNGHTALEHLPAAAADRLLRPRWSIHLEPQDSAAHYEAALRSLIPTGRPDMILLGMGDDGHTASLFPGTTALSPDPHRWYVANRVPQLETWRLTATPSLLLSALEIVVLVSGASKARVLAEVIEGPDDRYPIQLLRSATGTVTILCDTHAAAGLTGTG